MTDPAAQAPALDADERARRWRMILGGHQADGIGIPLDERDMAMDHVLAALYDPDMKGGKGGRRSAGLGSSAPSVSRWLGDIRTYFPSSIVRVMQQDAMDRLGLSSMLTQPEMLEAMQPDVHLVASLISLSGVIPEKTKDTARMVVRKVVDELLKKLEEPMRSAITGALNRAMRNNRPRHSEIDWGRTIRLNLRHYQPEYNTIIPERLVGYGRKAHRTMRQIILCIDQSGSMADSIVYSSIFGAVMASLPAVKTHLVLFDTSVVDMTEQLNDPVDLLFGTQLGGGTDINSAVAYCQELIQEPRNTIFVLISDLYEGGVEANLLARTAEMVQSGVQYITLLALSDSGTPSYDQELAHKMTQLGAPSFACTPDLFPSLMAAAIKKEDIGLWASEHEIVKQ